MSLTRRTYARKKSECSEDEINKENVYITTATSRTAKVKAMEKIKENVERESPTSSLKSKNPPDAFDLLYSSPLKQEVNFKPLSFWEKKVKDLEEKNNTKKKKCQLYELSESDGSNSSKEGGKKMKKKGRTTARQRKTKKERNDIIYKFSSQKPLVLKKNEENKQNKNGSIVRERIVLKRLNEKLTSKEEMFTFNNVAAFGLTSTPGKCGKINVVGGSNFDFLSPILFCEGVPKNGRPNDDGNCEENTKSLLKENCPDKENLVTPKRCKTRGGNENPDKRPKRETYFVNECDRKESGDCVGQDYMVCDTFEETPVESSNHYNSRNLSTVNDFYKYYWLLQHLLQLLSASDRLLISMDYSHHSPLSRFASLPALREDISLEDRSLNLDLAERDTENLMCDTVNGDLYSQSFIRESRNVQTRRGFNHIFNSRGSAEETALELSRVMNTENCIKRDSRNSTCIYLNNSPSNVSDIILCENTFKYCEETLCEGFLGKSTVTTLDIAFIQSLSENQQTHGNNDTKNKISVVKDSVNGSNQYSSNGTSFYTTEDNSKLFFTAGTGSSLFNMSPDTQSEADSFNCSVCKNTRNKPVEVNFHDCSSRQIQADSPKGDVTSVLVSAGLKQCVTPVASKHDVPDASPIARSAATMADFSFNNDFDFPLPIFESTVCRNSAVNKKKNLHYDTMEQRTEMEFMGGSNEMSSVCESRVEDVTSFQLKPGKKWAKSAMVLKKALNGTLMLDNVSTVKGRNYQPFVEEILSMQSGIPATDESNLFESVTAITSRMLSLALTSRNIGNRTVKVMDQTFPEVEGSFRTIFSRANNEENLTLTPFKDRSHQITAEQELKIFSARDLVLMRCNQEEPLPFEEYFNKKTLKKCRKIGEGTFGEVFLSGSNRVIKIMPIEGSDDVNGEPQKRFDEILTEMVVAMELSDLRKGDNYQTNGFSELKRCWCVVGKYPQYLIDLWNDFDRLGRGSENDSPVMFKSDQMYIILEFCNGGKDLEAFVFASPEQSLSILFQTVYSLAVAERVLEFEHRDMHWGNILIAPTKEKFFKILFKGEEYRIPTRGVKVTIIDFTFSRITYDGCSIYNDLSADPTLFTSQGDYQFEIYRMMRKEVKDDWSIFNPKTNIFWIHYVVDKMINMVHYKRSDTKIHKIIISRLKNLHSRVLNYSNSEEFLMREADL